MVESKDKAATNSEPSVKHGFWQKYGWYIIAFIVTILIIASIKLIWFSKPKGPLSLTSAVSYSDIEKTIIATGALVPYLEVNVGSRASGIITNLNVEIGDLVQKGETIANIDSATQINVLKNAQAALAANLAQKASYIAVASQSRLNQIRQTNLYQADAASRLEYEAAVAAAKTSKANIDLIDAQILQGQIAVNNARISLNYTNIIAPISGTVLSIVTKQGQTVNAAQSAPTIVTLGQLDRMTIKAQIAEADVINVQPNMAVYFTILGDPNHKYRAFLKSIEPAPNDYVSGAAISSASSASAVYYFGIFDVDNSDGRLRTSMTANVSIIESSVQQVLSIPFSALGDQSADGSYLVNVQTKDNKQTKRKITIGINDGANVQVLSGLKLGEEVALPEIAPASASSTGNRGPQRMGGL